MEISSLNALRSVLLDTFASATSSRHQPGASSHRERHHNIGRSRRTSHPRPDAYATGKHVDDIGKHYTDGSSFFKPFRGAHTETFLNRVSRNTNMFVNKDTVLVGNESDNFADSLLKNVRSQTVEIDPDSVSEDGFHASLTPEELNEMKNNPEIKCYWEAMSGGVETTPSGGCNVSWDSLLCWPSTPSETRAVLPCFSELNGIRYDISQNASRWCHGNGTWERTNYSACHHLRSTEAESAVDPTFYIYFGGYSLSLLALVIAIWIFLYFKDLRCLRNTIHTNLMFTYLLTDFMWILTLILQMSVQTDMTSCVFLIILLHYFHLTSFFWMFVEGLYLYMLVVETFYGENMKLKVYAGIGWGGPSIFVISWAIAKIFTTDVNETQIVSADTNMWRHCPWMSPHQLDWLYQAPALIVLAINLLFLLIIMWVLITKLRSANTLETQQYRKATKALLVLIPLLGTTYVLVIVGPTEGISRNIYDSIRAILLSTQGFTVALFYCFLNTEVQNTMRHHIECWRERRSISGSRRYTYNYSQSKDWSPRSRTESIRLYSQPTNIYKKRESTASETTTTTLVGGLGRMSNGSQPGGRASCTSPFLVAGSGENAV